MRRGTVKETMAGTSNKSAATVATRKKANLLPKTLIIIALAISMAFTQFAYAAGGEGQNEASAPESSISAEGTASSTEAPEQTPSGTSNQENPAEAQSNETPAVVGMTPALNEGQVSLMASNTLTIDTSVHPLNTTNLQSVLQTLYPNPADINAATTLEFTGNGSIGLGPNMSIPNTPMTLTPSMAYLNSLNINTLDLSSFSGTLVSGTFGIPKGTPSKITTAALGPNITSLPGYMFFANSSLTTVSNSLGAPAGVIDLASTNVTSFDALGCQFSFCHAATTITLGKNIPSLPTEVFSRCYNLKTISDTLAHAQSTPGVIDLEKTGITSIEGAGGQFRECTSLTTVTLGDSIPSLSQWLFYGCPALTTISDTLAHVQSTPGVIDLAETGVVSLKDAGRQFHACTSITTVTFNPAIPYLPTSTFSSCTSLTTVSDSLANAQGVSAGLVDMDRVPSLGAGGYQFHNTKALVYKDLDTQELVQFANTGVSTVFVSKNISTLTVNANAFANPYSAPSPNPKLYLHGPQATSPTTVVNPGNVAPAAIAYYYEVAATTDGNGSIAKSSGGFLPSVFENREVAAGNLASGNNYADELQGLTYTITPNAYYEVDKIEAEVNGTTTDITSACIDNLDGTWSFPGVANDTKFHVSFKFNPVTVTYDANGGTGGPSPETVTAPGSHALATSPTPTHASVSGNAVVFLGWTASPDSHIYTKADAAPALISTVSITNANMTVYAVWGLEETDEGTPAVVPAGGTGDTPTSPTQPGGPAATVLTAILSTTPAGSVSPTTPGTTNVQDESTPLASGEAETHCWVHYIILVGLVITLVYGTVAVVRSRRFKDQLEDLEALALQGTMDENTSSASGVAGKVYDR